MIMRSRNLRPKLFMTALIAAILLVSSCAPRKNVFKQLSKPPISSDAVRSYIDSGANLNERDNHGSTLLMYMARAGKLEIVKMLVEKGADVNIQDAYGTTALMDASYVGHAEVAAYLVERGADVNKKSRFGTALTYAASNGNNIVVSLLIEKGTDIKTQSNDGDTALLEALRLINMTGRTNVPLKNVIATVMAISSRGATFDFPILVADPADIEVTGEDGVRLSVIEDGMKVSVIKLKPGRNKIRVKYVKARDARVFQGPEEFEDVCEELSGLKTKACEVLNDKSREYTKYADNEFVFNASAGDILFLPYSDKFDRLRFELFKIPAKR